MSAVLPHNTTTTQHCSQIIIRAYRCKKCHVFVTLKAFYRFLIVCRYRLWHQELFWMNHLTWMNQMTLLGFCTAVISLSVTRFSEVSVRIWSLTECFHSYEHDYWSLTMFSFIWTWLFLTPQRSRTWGTWRKTCWFPRWCGRKPRRDASSMWMVRWVYILSSFTLVPNP